MTTLVVSSDPCVGEWATGLGLAVIDDPGTLDRAAGTPAATGCASSDAAAR